MDVVHIGSTIYQSYLLRMWRDERQNTWRASLQSTTTDQIHHFPSLEALVAFLVTQSAAAADGAVAWQEASGDGAL